MPHVLYTSAPTHISSKKLFISAPFVYEIYLVCKPYTTNLQTIYNLFANYISSVYWLSIVCNSSLCSLIFGCLLSLFRLYLILVLYLFFFFFLYSYHCSMLWLYYEVGELSSTLSVFVINSYSLIFCPLF